MRGALRVGVTGLAVLLLSPLPAAAGRSAPVARHAEAPGAGLPPPPGTTTLVSERVGGGFPGGTSQEPSISDSGRWVAFASGAADLVAGDTNRALDVFLRDRRTGKIIRLPALNGRPVPPGGSASEPAISADGSVVAFTYQPPGDGAPDAAHSLVLAWERASGRVDVVSRNVRNGSAAGSRQPSVSADGRYIAYTSDNNLIAIPDGNGSPDVFRYDRRSGRTVLVSAAATGGSTAKGASDSPSISADGNLVAFVSDAGRSLITEDTGAGRQVYVRDVGASRTERISVAADGGPADGQSRAPAISADGRYVAFESNAANLVARDRNGASDVFRRDRQASTTELVSVSPEGSPAGGPSGQAAISADGRMVSFVSTATNLVALAPIGAGPLIADVPQARLAAAVVNPVEVFIRDLDARDTVLVSVDPAGQPGGAQSITPVVAAGGRYVAFESTSPVLVRGDRNRVGDVFIRDLPPAPRLNPAVVDFGTRAVGSAPTAGAAVLANAGWGPLVVSGANVAGAMRAEFPIAIDGCAGVTLYRGEACTVTMTFRPARKGSRSATLEVSDAFTGSPRTARLRGAGSQAQLELDPPVGPPGTVVVVTGSGFPAGAKVRLSWSRGITPTLPVVTADGRGRFRVQVLVFHNDAIGKRDLQAQQAGAAPFPPISSEMLVTTPSVIPPGFNGLFRLVDVPLVLVIRG